MPELLCTCSILVLSMFCAVLMIPVLFTANRGKIDEEGARYVKQSCNCLIKENILKSGLQFHSIILFA